MTSEEMKLMEKMKEKLREQDEMLKRLLTAPTKFSVVVRILNDKAVFVDAHGEFFEAVVPPGSSIRPGTVIKTNAETGAIVEVEKQSMGIGGLATVTKILDDLHAEIEQESGKKIVMVSFTVKDLKVGHRVMLDSTSNIIMHTFGSINEGFRVPEMQHVGWDDIGGLHEAKQVLKEAIELPISNPKIFTKYGRKPLKGIMLYGPPGCGKTMLAKAAYSSMAKLHGTKTVAGGFIYVKGPEVLTMWVGESEAKIRGMFSRAREHHQEHGFPALVFLDEADAILGKRGRDRHSGMSNTIVPQFLSEMDGLGGEGQPLVLIATNRPDSLDPAVVRDGRVDRKVKIDRPGQNEVKEIFKINLKGKPTGEPDLAEHGAKELMCDSKVLALLQADDGTKHRMTLANAVNGAMVSGIVDRATELAMRRELTGKPGGITKADLSQGVLENAKQMADIDINDEIMDFAELRGIQVRDVARISQ